MEEQQGRRLRRLRAQRPPVLPDTRESAATVLPEIPRVGALDALLREVDSLRLTLETDLTLAAAAVENGAPQVASDIIDSDRDGLRAFEERALGHVAELAGHRRRFRVPAAPFIAAAAVAGFLLGVVPQTSGPTETDATNASSDSVTQSLKLLQDATNSGQTAQAVQAAFAIHAQLLNVVAQAKTDPVAAATALALLQREQQVLASAGNGSPALTQALATSRQLTRMIKAALTTQSRPVVPAPRVAVAAPSPSPTPAPKTTPSPSASPKPKPTSSPTSQTSSPHPTSSPTTGPPLPRAMGLDN